MIESETKIRFESKNWLRWEELKQKNTIPGRCGHISEIYKVKKKNITWKKNTQLKLHSKIKDKLYVYGGRTDNARTNGIKNFFL